MSETKHTSGPWKVIPPGHGHPTEYLCVELDSEQMYSTVEMRPADAHLIAAAPDLLEALEFALRQTGCDGDLCTEDWHEEARKAIAKAKGED